MNIDKKKIAKDMSNLIKCKTVSNRDESLVDRAEFKKLEALLPKQYPALFKACKPSHVGKTGIVFHIPSKTKKDHSSNTVVLMAHYDVVPANKDEWSKDPFCGTIEDGTLWGRGTLDTKGTFCSILESADALLASGWKPTIELYLAFSGEEEIDGSTCPDIVKWFENKHITPDFVLDEGGAIVDKSFPGVEGRSAMIGIAEKGSLNIECSITSFGGHASAPAPHTAAGYIAQAAQAIEAHPYRAQFSPAVYEMFKSFAPHAKQPYQFLFKHIKLFSPLIKSASRAAGGELNAMFHTTCAVTKLDASKAFNVCPPSASLGMNIRLLGTDTIDDAVAHIRHSVSKLDKQLIKHGIKKNIPAEQARVQIKVVNGMNQSRISDINCPQYKNLCRVITEQWPDVFISPYLMMACSDSRHYCRITDKVYRFSGMYMSKEERGMIHGIDERIKLDTLYQTVEFYSKLMQTF